MVSGRVQAPPERPSDETNAKQLELAHEQGRALQDAVENMTKEEAHGEERDVDDYIVGYAIEHAEGLYRLRDGGLEWVEPQQENAHVEVVVRDRRDGRFIPGLRVRATLIDAEGRDVGSHQQPFLWHPWLFHYGRNWQVPGDGRYTLRIHVDAPDFPRHDRTNGRRYEKPVDVEFDNVEIHTGRKISHVE